MQEITKAVDGEFTDIQIVERILSLRQDKTRAADALKRTTEELAQRLIDRGVTEAEVGDHLVMIGPKLLTEYDQNTLGSLKNCVTDDQVWITFKQLPSGKQLKGLSDLAGATAKAVIASAKRKIETDVTTVRIKKPRRKKTSRD